MSFLIAEEYFNIPVVSRIFRYTRCIRVARHGQEVTSVRLALRHLEEGRLLCLFPEGSLSGAGRGRLRRGRCGAALLALRSGAPIYPAFIFGGPQHTNVPRAWLLPSRRGILFGRPIYLKDYLGRRIDRRLIEQIGALLMAQLVALDPTKPNAYPKARPIPGGNKDDRRRRRVTPEALRAL
jgi:1-acyl-sn-glycerol-3-phosphate acyltransferase